MVVGIFGADIAGKGRFLQKITNNTSSMSMLMVLIMAVPAVEPGEIVR